MARSSSNADRMRAAQILASNNRVASELFETFGAPTLPSVPKRDERFRSLVSSIAAQQVSGKAAVAIFQRVVDLVGDDFTPARAQSLGVDQLRSAGLSGSKAASVVDLAEHCLNGSVRLDQLGVMDDQAVIDMLIQVRGIGVWTAQMVLLFDLRRPDIWPTGDLGVRVGFANAFGLEAVPTPRELDVFGAEFAPYRSIMAWWCWRSTGSPAGGRKERQKLTPNSETATQG